MRRPKYKNITEYKKAHKRTQKEVDNYKIYIRNYKGFVRLREKESERVKKLYERTKAKVKGKSIKQILKIWTSYNDSKEKINQTYKEKSLKYSSTGLVNYSKQDKVHTFEKNYVVSTKNPSQSIANFLKIHKTDENIRYFLIILEGKNSETGEKLIISDSFSLFQIQEFPGDLNEIYDDLIESISYRNSKSSANFELIKIFVRVTYQK
jgi:hypothetical protein